MGTGNTMKTHPELPEAALSHRNNVSVDYDASRKLINPLIYKQYIDDTDCTPCYGQFGDECPGLCDLSTSECGVCSMVICMGDLNEMNAENGLCSSPYYMNKVWQRALLLASVAIL